MTAIDDIPGVDFGAAADLVGGAGIGERRGKRFVIITVTEWSARMNPDTALAAKERREIQLHPGRKIHLQARRKFGNIRGGKG